MSIYNNIIERKESHKKAFALLIDPDKQNEKQLLSIIKKAEGAKIDYFFIGGSLLTNDSLDLCLSTIKDNSRHKSIEILKELENKKVLLVHNTFAKHEDIRPNYYCTCPKANLFIEKTLPDYTIFNSEKLCVGKDSLASNTSLSILEELQIIKTNSNFDLNTLLKIASKNGAEALGFSNLGTFEKGKTPGVNLISGLEKIEVIA